MSKAAELASLIGNINAGGGGVNRNVIINGAMNVAQRGTSTTGLGGNGANYSTVDRFYTYANGTAGRFTMTQDSSAPDGFANSLKLDCTTADTSIAAAEQLVLAQVIEGQNLQHLNKGTSSALPVAVSFYVKGNASATYMCALIDNDNSRMSTKQFSVTTDWTRITINVPADTTGALDDDNAGSFNLNFYLHAGSNLTGGTYTASTWGASTDANRAVGISSFFDSTDRTFFITGVQLEIGQNPTEFEHEPFDQTYLKCERYYQKSYIHSEAPGGAQSNGSGTYLGGVVTMSNYNSQYNQQLYHYEQFRTKMRAAPTAVVYNIYSGTAARLMHYPSGDDHTMSYAHQSENGFRVYATSVNAYGNNNGGDHYAFHYTADAEL